MSTSRSRLRPPSIAAVALAATLALLVPGALVAHADDLGASSAAGAVAVASGEPAGGPAEAAEPVEAAEATEGQPAETADPADVTGPAVETAAGSVDDPADEVVDEGVAEPAGEPIDEPIAEPVDEPVDEPAVDPVVPPIAENDPAPAGEQTPAAPLSLVGENLPVVTQDDYFVMAPGATLAIAAPGILDNDSDPEGDPFVAQQGSFTTWLGNTGYIGPNGEFGFTAASGFSGTDTITYFTQDAGHGGTEGTIYVTVQEQVDPSENHWPHTAADTYTTPQDQPLSMPSQLGVLANDTDDEGDLITTKAVGPIPTDNGGSITFDADGSFYYVPAAGFIGVDSVGYIAYDTFGGGSWGSLVISVTPPGTVPAGPNQAPVAADDDYSTPVNVPLIVDAAHGALVNDHDPEGTALTAFTYNWGQSQAGGTGTVASDGSFIYVAPAGITPQSQDYFQYMVTDEAGLPSYGAISITFTDAVSIVDDPGTDPGTGQGGHPGEPAQPGTGGSAGSDPGAPEPVLPSSPVVTASQTTASSRDDSQGSGLALTGLSLWPPLGGALGVLLLGALGLAAATRRRRSH